MFPCSKLNITPGARGTDYGLWSSSLFFPSAKISLVVAQFKDKNLGFFLFKYGKNFGIVFDSLVSVPTES